MFIRQVKKQRSKSSKVFYQYNLVQTSRINGKVKQKVILYLGSDPLMHDKKNRKIILDILQSKIFAQPDVFPSQAPASLQKLAEAYYEKYLLKYGHQQTTKVSTPPAPDKADMHQVDINGLQVDDTKSFGPEHLCRQVLGHLDLKKYLLDLGFDHQQATKALIAIAARAIYTSSEHKTAQILERNSELPACYDYSGPITHKQLYNIADKLFSHRRAIDRYLYRRITDMFDLEDKLVIFDISNTYFETTKANSHLAAFGRSKERRNDAPLVVFTGVINAEGFIRHSNIYEGNKADVVTLEDMVEDLEKYASGKAQKTVVMDAGIATEDNLAMLRARHYDYVCVSNHRVDDYEVDRQATTTRLTDRGNHEVALSVINPEDYPDTWMYVKSQTKAQKEQSMATKLGSRFEEEMENVRAALSKKGGTKKIDKVWQRIGRLREKYKQVSSQYDISVEEDHGTAIDLHWTKKENPRQKDKENGVYFIRTTYQNPDSQQLWDVYNTIREVESTFRCFKTDLKIRPVYHQRDERVESHIYLTILAYQLVNTIRYQLRQAGLHYDWDNIMRIMQTQTIQTMVIPTDTKNIHLRQPSRPIHQARQIYQATRCTNTQKPIKKYVVYH